MIPPKICLQVTMWKANAGPVVPCTAGPMVWWCSYGACGLAHNEIKYYPLARQCSELENAAPEQPWGSLLLRGVWRACGFCSAGRGPARAPNDRGTRGMQAGGLLRGTQGNQAEGLLRGMQGKGPAPVHTRHAGRRPAPGHAQAWRLLTKALNNDN